VTTCHPRSAIVDVGDSEMSGFAQPQSRPSNRLRQ
jgi:hypothetical protein